MSVRRGNEKGIRHHLEIETKNQKFLRNLKSAALIDLILAMTILFSDMTLTLHKSRIHCYWACSSHMSAALPAEAGCETWVRIFLKLAFIA